LIAISVVDIIAQHGWGHGPSGACLRFFSRGTTS
jgi:hypothetical protein